MSTRYDIICETCGEILRVCDNNGADEMMLTLCRNADEIAAMADVLDAIGGTVRVEWMRDYETLDVAWFRKHLGHELIPIDEYGAKMNACQKYTRIQCEGGHIHGCGLERDHDGECKLTHNSNLYNARLSPSSKAPAPPMKALGGVTDAQMAAIVERMRGAGKMPGSDE